ncbi:MAG: C25 family cysteine peptidase [Candidatus Contendobacter sp.]|nr:C25 family cysteine peptidase [Candidatus Contendobacter sp.]MDG4558392.1 C25 family cysteine peptidase [Candidatus Contendobacter sp.]
MTFGDPQTTPVTLSSFHTSPQGAGVLFEWSTVTEVGNLGFNLYAEAKGARTKVNAALIPSKVVNSLTRQTYSYTDGKMVGQVFWIEEVDIKGKTQSYGPFALGESYGDDSLPEPIPWNSIRAQHASARAQTQQQRLTAWKHYDYPRINFRVTQKGIYRVTYEDLAAVGVTLAGVPENKLALVNRGQPAPIYVSTKGTFGPGGWIEFYGEPSTSLYTDVNVYQLQVDSAKALRLGDDPKPPRKNENPETFYMETTTWDENREYAFYSPTADPWYNAELFAGGGQVASKTFNVPVDNYVSGAGAVTLGLNVWGGIDYRHHLDIGLNGTPLGSAVFKGIEAHSTQVDVPTGVLRQGDNQLTLTLPGDAGDPWDIVDVDRYSLTYPRAFVARNDLLSFASAGKQFQIRGLNNPSVVVHRQESNGQWVRLREITVSSANPYTATFSGTGQTARYVVAGATRKPEIEVASSDLTLTLDPAQLLIIAHPDFISGLQSLVTRRQAQYQVKLADVDAVYDQFGDGTVDPTAIQRYIRHAVEKLGTQYVLLVGGDSYDYKNYLGLGSMSFIPSLYAPTDEIVRYAPVDPLLADLNGDGMPDVPIGRLPVRTATELQTLLTKIWQYETKSYVKTAVLAADEGFAADADAFADALPGGWSVERAYLDQMSASDAKALIKTQVSAGSVLLGFVGHSGPTRWTYRGLFNTGDVPGLGNAGRPTLVSQWGCWNTYYVEPRYNTLAQSFLVAGPQGAAAVLGATTLTQDNAERMLGMALTPLLAQPGMTIGDALQQAKRQVAAQNPAARDILLGWTLLGDPTQVVTP